MKNKHVGSDFDDFLREEGILDETQATAVKRVIAFQIKKIMLEKKITKVEMTRRMHIKNRALIDRLMDPTNKSVTLLTLEKAANALGKRLKLQLV
jgi:DNA-binding Xre family transcriptional regulator